MLLAIDVGNTLTKVWNVTRGGHAGKRTSEIANAADAKELLDSARNKDLKIIGCSVVPSVSIIFDEASRDLSTREPTWINASLPLGIDIRYETPTTLGADRIANALGALELCKPPII